MNNQPALVLPETFFEDWLSIDWMLNGAEGDKELVEYTKLIISIIGVDVSKIVRWGYDTSSNDEFDIIDNIESGNYVVQQEGIFKDPISKEMKKWHKIFVDDKFQIYVVHNEIAAEGEDDMIYNGYYFVKQ